MGIPTAILAPQPSSRQRKGLAQLGGYNLFVLTSWKRIPDHI